MRASRTVVSIAAVMALGAGTVGAGRAGADPTGDGPYLFSSPMREFDNTISDSHLLDAKECSARDLSHCAL